MIRTIRSLLTRLETYLAAGSLLLLLLLSLGQIFARNFFDTGLPAADTFARHLVLYVTFFGAVLAIESQSHIKIDVVTAWLSKKTINQLFRPIYFIGALVCGFLAEAAARFWYDSWQYALPAEKWAALMDLVLPVGFSLLCLHFLCGVLLGPPKSND